MIYDISRKVHSELATWPGDRRVETGWSARIGADSSVNVGYITTTLHAGTHMDAPLHFAHDGEPVDHIDLDRLVGPARVVDARDWEAIDEQQCAGLGSLPERVLFRTPHSELRDDQWEEELVSFTPNGIRALAEAGVRVVATDAPSVDPVDSKTLGAHHALHAHGIVNIEGVVLKDVPAGDYELIALPLALVGMDAAPVRAILRPL